MSVNFDVEKNRLMFRYNGMPVAAGELDFFKLMEYEFCGVDNADEEFVTFNYGGIRTTLRQEWVRILCNL
jgi:hypothetical protein